MKNFQRAICLLCIAVLLCSVFAFSGCDKNCPPHNLKIRTAGTDERLHNAYCVKCGQTFNEPHEFEMSRISSQGLNQKCTVCGYVKTLPLPEVQEIDDITQPFAAPEEHGTSAVFVKTKLKKGCYQFVCRRSNEDTYMPSAFLFSSSKKYIKSPQFPRLDYDADATFRSIVQVPKDGTYYIYLQAMATIETTYFCYETYGNYEKPFTVKNKEVSGVLEGRFDTELYSFEVGMEGAVVLTNCGTADVEICLSSGGIWRKLAAGKSLAYWSNPGKIKFFVANRFADGATNYNIKFNVVTNSDYGKSQEFDEMPTLSQQWSEQPFLLRWDSNCFAKLHADKRGYYTLEDENGMFCFAVTTKEGEPIYSQNDSFLLEEGDYIVQMYLFAGIVVVPDLSRVRYSYSATNG